MKKIIAIAVAVVIVVIIGGYVGVRASKQKPNEVISNFSKNDVQGLEEVKNENVETIEEILDEYARDNNQEVREDNQTVATEVSEKNKTENSNTSTKSPTVTAKENINQSSSGSSKEVVQEQPKTNVEEKQIVEEKTQVPSQEPKEKVVDEEYERLMKQVEYSTYSDCLNAGFDIALTDTVNILGFDPVEIIYKGQILGYKLKIHYTNPMQ